MSVVSRIRARLRRGPVDLGVTLVELCVVILLSGIVMTIVGTMFVTVAKQTVAAQGVRRSTADASNIMNVLSTTIRASIKNAVNGNPTPDPAVVVGTNFSVTVISYTDAGPNFNTPLQIRYRILNGQMIEERWYPTITAGYAVFPALTATPNATRILGNVVVNASTDPVFQYYDATGTALLAGGTGLSPADRANVASIEVDIKVQALTSQQVVELDNTVGMPNMNLQQGQG
jgi:hypothetical protein